MAQKLNHYRVVVKKDDGFLVDPPEYSPNLVVERTRAQVRDRNSRSGRRKFPTLMSGQNGLKPKVPNFTDDLKIHSPRGKVPNFNVQPHVGHFFFLACILRGQVSRFSEVDEASSPLLLKRQRSLALQGYRAQPRDEMAREDKEN
jgi:hypothetical protein